MYFNRYLGQHSSVRVIWKFPDTALEHAQVFTRGDKEFKVIKTEFIVDKKKILVDFVENDNGTLDIIVNGKSIFLVKLMERISVELLKVFAESIKDEL